MPSVSLMVMRIAWLWIPEHPAELTLPRRSFRTGTPGCVGTPNRWVPRALNLLGGKPVHPGRQQRRDRRMAQLPVPGLAPA